MPTARSASAGSRTPGRLGRRRWRRGGNGDGDVPARLAELHRTFGGEANLAILTRDGVPHHYAGNPENPVFTFRLDGIGIASTVHLLHRSLGVQVRRQRRHKPQARASEHHGHAGPNGTTRHRPSRAARQRLTRRARGRGRRRMTATAGMLGEATPDIGARPTALLPIPSWSGSRCTGWASRRSTPRWACSSRTASSSTTSCPRRTSGRRCSWSASAARSSGSSSSPPSATSATSPSAAGAGASPTSCSGPCSTSCSCSASRRPPRSSRWPRSSSCSASARTSRAARSRATCRTSSPSRRSASPAASSA